MMEAREIPLHEANAFVIIHHRHHDAALGHKWSLGAYKDGNLVGWWMEYDTLPGQMDLLEEERE